MKKRGITGNAWPWLHNWRERRAARVIAHAQPREIRAALERHRETILAAVPAAISGVLEREPAAASADAPFYGWAAAHFIPIPLAARIAEALRAPGPSGEAAPTWRMLVRGDLPAWARPRLDRVLRDWDLARAPPPA